MHVSPARGVFWNLIQGHGSLSLSLSLSLVRARRVRITPDSSKRFFALSRAVCLFRLLLRLRRPSSRALRVPGLHEKKFWRILRIWFQEQSFLAGESCGLLKPSSCVWPSERGLVLPVGWAHAPCFLDGRLLERPFREEVLVQAAPVVPQIKIAL